MDKTLIWAVILIIIWFVHLCFYRMAGIDNKLSMSIMAIQTLQDRVTELEKRLGEKL